MPTDKHLLRSIPKMDELLILEGIRDAINTIGHTSTTRAARETLDELRAQIMDGTCRALPSLEELSGQILQRLQREQKPNLCKVINATGVALHTNLGRAPLASSAVAAVCQVASGYTNLEYQLQSGQRGSRYSHVQKLLCELTGAEDAMVVNNNASAVLLLLSALAVGKEVVVSRGELVEIGGAFRVPDIMALSGAILREVGTTNRTRLSDYQNAIDEECTGALLKVHTSNFKIIGFTEDTSLEELVCLGKEKKLPVYYDLGGGSLLPLEGLGIEGEPSVPACVKTGVDVLCFSGDKLLGGPQAGILVGKKEAISALRRHQLTRALRIDKMTLAALEATLRLYREEGLAQKEVPTQRMLHETEQQLCNKANQLLQTIALPDDVATVCKTQSPVGGGSVPTQLLPSYAVQLWPKNTSVTQLEAALRCCETPIIARIFKDSLLLDVRTISSDEFSLLATGLRPLFQEKATAIGEQA